MLRKSRITTVLQEGRSFKLQRGLSQLIALTEKITTAEGETQTIIPFLSIVRNSQPTLLIPRILTPSFGLILQALFHQQTDGIGKARHRLQLAAGGILNASRLGKPTGMHNIQP
jgi:hypothetical protein